jgi:hypothetical protein
VAFRRVVIVSLFCAVMLTPALPRSQTVSATDSSSAVHTLPGSALGDSSRAFVPGAGVDALDAPFRSNTERPLSMYLARNTRMMFGYEIYHASQMECAWEGVGMGMTLGMCAGALGMTAGLWEEGTSWYIAGAMAALGAIWGSTKADDPGWTVRVRWEPDK